MCYVLSEASCAHCFPKALSLYVQVIILRPNMQVIQRHHMQVIIQRLFIQVIIQSYYPVASVVAKDNSIRVPELSILSEAYSAV